MSEAVAVSELLSNALSRIPGGDLKAAKATRAFVTSLGSTKESIKAGLKAESIAGKKSKRKAPKIPREVIEYIEKNIHMLQKSNSEVNEEDVSGNEAEYVVITDYSWVSGKEMQTPSEPQSRKSPAVTQRKKKKSTHDTAANKAPQDTPAEPGSAD